MKTSTKIGYLFNVFYCSIGQKMKILKINKRFQNQNVKKFKSNVANNNNKFGLI